MSVTVYPVIPTVPACDDYSVKINGADVSLNTARVSAVPFNRRWPGHQRDMDQSEAAQFLSLSMDEPIQIEITPREPFDAASVKIRPRSLGITPDIRDGKIRFTLQKPAYFTVEPYGRSRALHIFADPVADYGAKDGKGVIYFGAGEHDVGMIELHSGETLYLDEGAVVYACVRAMDAENIRIVGHGILDNSRNKEKILFEANEENNAAAVNNAERLHTVQLEYCTGVEIDGITIRDSLVYNVRPIGCRDFSVKNVKIIGCWRYNSDGIDMHNCVNVHIDNCFIRTFDDSICVKGFDCFYEGDVEKAVHEAMYRGGKSYDVFQNVLVENCVIWNDWGKCLEIGAETRAEDISSVVFQNCHVIHVMGEVLDCMNVDYADVHDVIYRDICIETDEVIPKPLLQRKDTERYENTDPQYMPTTISMSVVFHPEYSSGGTRRGKNRDFIFRNIRLYGDHAPRIQMSGYDEAHKTENVTISELYWNDKKVTALDGDNWDIRAFADNIVLKK